MYNMKINISIDGVLRNFLQKFEYHYSDNYLNITDEEKELQNFEYGIDTPIQTVNSFKFQSKEERDFFMYIEYPLEIFGHAGLTSATSMSDLNKLIFENKKCVFTLIGLNEYGKAKPSTLFFLSKNGFLGNNIRFISDDEIKNEWDNCDVWITDNEQIINAKPLNKICYKFETNENKHITCENKINNIKQIEELCLKFLEKSITSILMRLLKNVKLTLKKTWNEMMNKKVPQ